MPFLAPIDTSRSHTTVIGASGQPFEVQIRTEKSASHRRERHRRALEIQGQQRHGDGARRGAAELDPSACRVAEKMTDSDEFLSSLKIDLYPDECTPSRRRGGSSSFRPAPRRWTSPTPFTPRFATVRRRQGRRPHGSAAHELRTGDIVGASPRRITSRATTGSPSSRARARATRSTLAQRGSAEARDRYRAEAAGARSTQVQSSHRPDWRPGSGPDSHEFSVATAADCWPRWPGQEHCAPVATKLAPGIADPPEAEPRNGRQAGPSRHERRGTQAAPTGSDSLQVEGRTIYSFIAHDVPTRRGEEIIGYVTRGKDVAVHARSCPNVQNLLYEATGVSTSSRRARPKAPARRRVTRQDHGCTATTGRGAEGTDRVISDGTPTFAA